MGKTPSFPRKRESRSLKLLMSPTDWMPASEGMTNYDFPTVPSTGSLAVVSFSGNVFAQRIEVTFDRPVKLRLTVTIPVPDHDEIRIGALQSIIRQSSIPRSEFES
jgi:hypothetical protein